MDTVDHHDAVPTSGPASSQGDVDLLHCHALRDTQLRPPVEVTLCGGSIARGRHKEAYLDIGEGQT